jgi:hypothetical protein
MSFLTDAWSRLTMRSRSRHCLELVPASEVLASAHKDGLLLVNIKSGRVFVCNRTGARIWTGLNQGLTPAALAEQFSADYAMPKEVASQDIQDFLASLESEKFVTQSKGAAA